MVTTTEPIEKLQQIPLLRKQAQFLYDEAYEVLYSGAFGAGKTRALCCKLVNNALRPGTVHGLFRKTRSSLVRTTLRTLLEHEGGLPPVLPPGTYKHNKALGEINIHGGGTIIYTGSDNHDAVKSMNLVSAAVDESTELDEDEYTMILGRLRMRGGVRQVFCATNPESPSHWQYKRFFENEPPAPVNRPRSVYRAKTTDNILLPQDYLDVLCALTGSRYQRYVLGMWVPFEGLVYGDYWDRKIHTISDARQNKKTFRSAYSKTFITGVDFGYTNPAFLGEFGQDNDGRLHMFRELYRTRMLPAAFTAEAVRRDKRREAIHVCDPAAAEQIAEFRDAGLACTEANNKVRTGINLVMNRLAVQGDGRPLLTISASCENTIREFETYAWHPDKDEPVKEFDHAMDGIRYAVAFCDAGLINPTVGEPPARQDDSRKARKAARKAAKKRKKEREAELLESDEVWD